MYGTLNISAGDTVIAKSRQYNHIYVVEASEITKDTVSGRNRVLDNDLGLDTTVVQSRANFPIDSFSFEKTNLITLNPVFK